MPRTSHLALLFLLVMLGMGWPLASYAGDSSVWSGLVLGTNEEHPNPPAPELEKLYDKLKGIFGYNQYELMGQHQELMDSPDEHWLIPSKDFSLLVNCKKAQKPGFNYRVKLDLYQDKTLLAGMEARLRGQNLLFIRGPFYGKGQLVIVLLVK